MKWIRTDDVFETGRNGWVMAPSEDFEAIFGLKQNGRGHNYDLTNLDLAG